MVGLELIRYNPADEKTDKNKHYWRLDMHGIFLESKLYKSKRKALDALVSNNIHWDSINIDSNVVNSVHNQ